MPGVKISTFRQLLHYLCTDRIPQLQPIACIPLIELANRLCLNRLVQLVESHMVNEMQKMIDAGGEVTMECLTLLEPCQVLISILFFYFIVNVFVAQKFLLKSVYHLEVDFLNKDLI